MLPTDASGQGSAVFAYGGGAATLTIQRPQPHLLFMPRQAWVSNGSLTVVGAWPQGSSTIQMPLEGVGSLVVINASEPWTLTVR